MSLLARAPHRSLTRRGGTEYESAFVEFLRLQGSVALGVDESRRSLIEGEPLKSMDYVVLTRGGNFVVDVKGKRYPGGPPSKPRRVWENWVFDADVHGLSRWAEAFGAGFEGLILFVYKIGPEVTFSSPVQDLLEFQGERYLFRGIRVAQYAQRMRRRSPKWGTMDLSRDDYRALVQPLSRLFGEPWEQF
jgi:hypothetical protein